MNARAGVDPDRIEVAVVVHGKAIFDVSGEGNGNADLVDRLLASLNGQFWVSLRN